MLMLAVFGVGIVVGVLLARETSMWFTRHVRARVRMLEEQGIDLACAIRSLNENKQVMAALAQSVDQPHHPYCAGKGYYFEARMEDGEVDNRMKKCPACTARRSFNLWSRWKAAADAWVRRNCGEFDAMVARELAKTKV
jgi:hypothetical protein